MNLLILVSGLFLQAWFLGLDGFVSGLLGLGVGFGIFIPFYLLGGFSAGDVKLMAVVGTFLGPLNTLLAAGLTLFAGAVMGVLILILKHGLKAYLSRNWMTFKMLVITRQFKYEPPAPGEAAAKRFPYATAVTAGTLSALAWLGMMDLSGVTDLLMLLWFA